jgi:solute carrier family 25, member 39/40
LSTLYRDVPFSAIYWSGYESSRHYLHQRFGSEDSNPFFNFISGFFSGVVSSVVTHPFDVIKTQHQKDILPQKNVKRIFFFFKFFLNFFFF